MTTRPLRRLRRPVLDVWCELQCPDCHGALEDLRALRARYGDRLDSDCGTSPWRRTSTPTPPPRPPRRPPSRGRAGRTSRRCWPDRGTRPSGEKLLMEVAGELGLDAEELDTALIDGRHLLIVDADQAEGKAIGSPARRPMSSAASGWTAARVRRGCATASRRSPTGCLPGG